MNALEKLQDMPRSMLIDLIHMLGRNWLTVDGLWFQMIERDFGVEKATQYDEEMWDKQSLAEARRLKKTLNIIKKGPLAVAEANLFLTSYFNKAFNFKIEKVTEKMVVQTCLSCPNQERRIQQGQEPFPCKKVGLRERLNFCQVIDPEVNVRCVLCPPDQKPEDNAWCRWEFFS